MDDDVAAVERWFLRRGIPHFIAGYGARTHVFTRALPFLVVAYVLNAIPITSDWHEAWTGMIVALPILLGTWVISNLARRQPPFARPRTVGPVELTLFVVGPALAQLVQGEVVFALWSVVASLVVLALTYVVTSYGLVPLTGWAVRQMWSTLRIAGAATTRALPLLLVAVTFIFLATEVWQAFAELRGIPYALAELLFVGSGLAFLTASVRRDIGPASAFDGWDDVRAAAADTPAADLEVPDEIACEPTALNRRQRLNVLLVAVAKQVLVATAVALAIGLFFLVFGFLVIGSDLVKLWTLHDAHVWWTLHLSGQELVLSEELVRVSGFIATFSGFYYAVYSISDPSFRAGMADDNEASLRELFAARRLYLAARTASTTVGGM